MFPSIRPSLSTGSRLSGLYTHVGVEGAAAGDSSGHELIAMLFDGLLGSIARARGALAAADIEGKSQAIGRAVRIVGEGLRASLDTRRGGKIARDLDDVYAYVELRLTHANLRNDDAALEECASLLRPLLDAWKQIAPQVHQGSVPVSLIPSGGGRRAAPSLGRS